MVARRLAYWLKGWTKLPRELQRDLAELAETPLERLRKSPITIRPLKLWPGALILLPLSYFFGMTLGRGQLAWGIGGIVAATIISAAAWWTYQVYLEMHAEGVIFRCRSQEVLCPWELFTASGNVFEKGLWAFLPINPEFANRVELMQHKKPTAQGWSVKTDFFCFEDGHSLKLTNGFAVAPEVLLHWLNVTATVICRAPTASNVVTAEVQSAAALGSPAVPSESVSTTAATTSESAVTRVVEPGRVPAANSSAAPNQQHYAGHTIDLVEVEDGIRITVHATRLVFPDECCVCGGPAEGTSTMTAPTLWNLYVYGSRHVDVEIPSCKRCRRTEFWRAVGGFALAYTADLSLCAAALALLLGRIGDNFSRFALVALFLSLLPIRWVLSLGPRIFLRARAWYAPHDRTLTFQFGNRLYGQKMAALVRNLHS